MNPLIHINYRIWTLWTPSWYWDNWSPESCSEKLPFFALPIIMKSIAYRMGHHTGIRAYSESIISWTGMVPLSEWVIDLSYNYQDWRVRQTS